MSEEKYLTATDYYRFLQCPHWPYYERFADKVEQTLKREPTESEAKRMEDGIDHEKDVVAKLYSGKDVIELDAKHGLEAAYQKTLEYMKSGAEIIYQGTLFFGDWVGRPDILERREGESVFGSWYYVPVDVKSSHSLVKYQIMQLVFYATLLEKIQGRFPAEPAIINIDAERLPIQAHEYIKEFQELTAELSDIRAGIKPDPVLRKSCFDVGVWGKACERYARMNDDIALLYNIDVKKLRALRSLGVRTVQDAAMMDISALDGAAPGLRLHGLDVAKRQAQSLKKQLVIIRVPVSLPQDGLEIHFDIESDPPNDKDYLYGFLIREKSGDRYLPFIAEKPEDEEKMWREFLKWIEGLPPNYWVYHFAVYEKTRLTVLEKRYGGSEWLNYFRTRMIDLKEIVSSSVVFPLNFYGLKYVAPFLGFSWTGSVKGGGQSVDVFEKYLKTQDKQLLQSIINYNHEDVKATALLKDWLVKYAKEITTYEKAYPWEK